MEDQRQTEDKSPACIPFFAHENAMMHSNHTNKRMLIAMIAMCVTFILTILVFVVGYTVREKNWLDTLSRVTKTPVAEVQDGVHE